MYPFVRNKLTRKLQTHEMAYKNRADGSECLVCGVALDSRCSVNGNYFPRIFPGRHHAPGCPCVEGEDNRIIDMSALEIESFFDHAMKDEGKSKGGGDDIHPGPPKKNKFIISKIRSLKDLWKTGFCAAEDFLLNDKTWLRDILINRHTICCMDTNSRDLGKRVIFAKPIKRYQGEEDLILRFAVYFQVNGRINKYIYGMQMEDRKAYWDTYDQLFPKAADGKRKPKFSYVLIMGDFKRLPKPECEAHCGRCSSNEKWPCQGYQYAVCVKPKKQIYCAQLEQYDNK